jgi:hypothetical protein
MKKPKKTQTRAKRKTLEPVNLKAIEPIKPNRNFAKLLAYTILVAIVFMVFAIMYIMKVRG